jgi:hypothetical protein
VKEFYGCKIDFLYNCSIIISKIHIYIYNIRVNIAVKFSGANLLFYSSTLFSFYYCFNGLMAAVPMHDFGACTSVA